MKKTKKKPYKSLLQNAFWSFGQQLRYVPSTFVLSLLRVPINIGVSYALLYLPSLVIAEVTGGQPLSHAALTVGALILAIFVGKLIQRTIFYLLGSLNMSYCYHVTNTFTVKTLTCFYQLYEKPNMRDLEDRASKATQMWNGVQPITDLPRETFGLLENVLSYILFGTIVSFVSPWLIPILTLAPVVNWFCTRAYQKWEYAHRDECTEIDRKLWYVLREPCDFAAAKDIRIYGLIDWFKEMFAFFSKERAKWDRKGILYGFLSRIADLLVILLRDGAAYALLIVMTLRGEITVDKFVLYFAAISSFASMIGSIVRGWTSLHSISLQISDFREYMDFPDSDGTGEANIADYLGSAPEIVFDHVSFRYEGAEQDTIHDLCLTIHAGEKLALVGLNGAGKTTLVKLLCGLYMPTSGEIRINGTPMGKFYRKDYYKLFSPVFQDIKTAFFSLAQTVSGQPDEQTDFDLAERCMRMAGLGDKIDALPNGIHTKLDKQVNKDGIELSGGQAQKLMLARALYKNAPVLVLDEPTSALDPIAESEIYQQYHEMSAGKSALFISHRLASTRFCNRIVYLKDGRIAEEGSHEELVRRGGEYSELYEMQSCWYREDAKKGEEIA